MELQPAPLGPGDLPVVFDCLRGCLSQDVHVQKQAEAALISLGTRPGFCSCLAEIILNRAAEHSARWLAAVHFKNSVTKYWRSHAPQAISEDEKNYLRPRLLLLLDQEDSQIAVQTAVVLAKVARLDYPKSWPSLFTDLLGRLHKSNHDTSNTSGNAVLTVRRCYLALHHILKELSTKRLAADQRTFESITSQLLEPLWNQWNADTGILIAQLPAVLQHASPLSVTVTDVLLVFERWILQLKSLRRMLIFGFPSDSRTMELVPAIEQCGPIMFQTLDALLRLVCPPRPQSTTTINNHNNSGHSPNNLTLLRSQPSAMLARGCLKIVKTLRQMSETHPWSVLRCGLLLQSLELCCSQLNNPTFTAGHVASDFTRQCLQFLHSAIRCAAFRGSPAALALSSGKGREQLTRLKDMSAEVAPLLKSFWSERQQNLIRLIITQFFPLTDKEMDIWKESGEEFHDEVDHGAWEESVRGCAEHVFVALLEVDRDALAPVVVQILLEQSSPSSSVRSKAAAYHALAIGAYDLYEVVDFSAWLHSSLLAEASNTSPDVRPLRRAAIKLFSSWVSKLKKDDRPPMYHVLVGCLSDKDPAIYLAAVAALHALIDDWEFDESQFSEYVPTCLHLAGKLLSDVTEFETQVEIFSLINLIVDRLGDGAALYAPGLLSLLPSVWQYAEGQSLLRIQIMIAMQRLIHVLGPESPATYPVLIPILSVSTDPNTVPEGSCDLLEDGLYLWLVALRHAPGPHPALTAPLSHLLWAMEGSTEYISIGMRLLTSCILIDGQTVLGQYGQRIATIITNFIGNVNERGMLLLIPVLDIIVQAFPAIVPTVLATPLRALLEHILVPSVSSYVNGGGGGGGGRGKHGDNNISGSTSSTQHHVSSMVISSALGVFGRIFLTNASAFWEMLRLCVSTTDTVMNSELSSSTTDPTHRLFFVVLDTFIDKFDAISTPPSRKLAALALCSMLTAPLPGVLHRCSGIVSCVTSVWFELESPEGIGSSSAEYLAGWTAPKFDDLPLSVNVSDAEGEENRRLAIFNASPVAKYKLGEFCRQQMGIAAGVHGSTAFNEALNSMDPHVGQQLQQMLA